MDKYTAKMIGDEIKAAVTEIAKKHGYAVPGGIGGTFGADGCRYRFEITKVGENGRPANKHAKGFKYASLLGLAETDLGRTIKHLGVEYTLVGLNHRSSKWPVEVERVTDGKTFRFPAPLVKNLLAQSKPLVKA